ncbi:hypothetical protein [Sporosarcina highlanderae]|uniref:Uncharacterized protein n=1 Tax=Sporosarcina highlanderae TaxID=3035916 RepID=A0ABT8JX43_9BACL|nr:hypothetical protein [Sporosarcina highlanderae]MDN4609136.1 hypothetical protein [Sporosarcina highlanderae]
MTHEELNRANEIQREIRKLERFILSAEKVWTGKIIKRTTTYIFKSTAYGAIGSSEYEMDTDMKNRVLDVLREKLTELKGEFARL